MLEKYRPWLYAASLYNLVWGTLNILFPVVVFQWIGLPTTTDIPFWRVAAMFVLVYAPAYAWAARNPERHAPIILIATLGKVLGPLGFLWSWMSGQLPLEFGWVILGNDLIWLPAFGLYLRDYAALHGGVGNLVRGE